MTKWTQLGPRERELLAVLRRSDAPLTARDLLDAVRRRGDGVAYTTVKRTADRLVEKGLVERDAERHRGATRHRYRFDVEAAREQLLTGFVDELRAVLGDPAIEQISLAVGTNDDGRTNEERTSDERTDDGRTGDERTNDGRDADCGGDAHQHDYDY